MDAKEIRARVTEFRKGLSKEEIERRSAQVGERLESFIRQTERDKVENHTVGEGHPIGGILCFYPLPGEVDLRPLYQRFLKEGRRLFFPKTNANDIQFFEVASLSDFSEGAFRVYEPIDCSKERELFFCLRQRGYEANILCITPGVAFSEEGHRIGFGRGYYDRFFAAFAAEFPNIMLHKAGVCFCEQMYDITQKPHDVEMDVVANDNELCNFRPDAGVPQHL